MKTFLETERIVLREFTELDLGALIDLNSDLQVMRQLTGGAALTPEFVRDEVLTTFLRLHSESPNFCYWAAVEKATGVFIGWFQFCQKEIPEIGVELGYRLEPSAWNKGYATEVSLALLAKGFGELGVKRVFSRAMASNSASIRVMQKVGLKFIRQYSESEFPIGQQAAVIYGLTNPNTMPTNKSQFDLVRRLAMALPNVVESTVHGAPSWKLNGKLLACEAIHKTAEPNSLLVRVPPADREQLLSAMPGIYYVTSHNVNAQVVLVRLDQIDSQALKSLLRTAWLSLSDA